MQRELPQQTYCGAQRALEEIRGRIGTGASRDAVIELEQRPDLALLVVGYHYKPLAARPNPGFRMFRLVQHEWEEAGMHSRTSGPGTQRSRAAASITSTLSHPVSPRLPRSAAGRRGALFLPHVLLQRPARKRPSPDRERALTCGN